MGRFNLSGVKEFTNFRRPVGGFIIKFGTAEDLPEKEYFKVPYEIIEATKPEDEEFVGMYAKRKKENSFDFPKIIISYKESALPMFKGNMRAISESNNLNLNIDGDFDFDAKDFKGKVCGAIIGEEEYENQKGQIRVRSTIRRLRSVDAIRNGDFKMPELKKLSQEKKESSPFDDPFAKAAAQVESTKVSAPIPAPAGNISSEISDDDIPF